MTRLQGDESRLGVAAARKRNCAPWREDASVGPATWWRDMAGDCLESESGRDVGDRLDEAAGVRVARTSEQPVDRPGLDDAARVHHENVLRQLGDDREVVTHVDGPDVVLRTSSRTVSRTCAWVVTSRPVVGSSRTMTGGRRRKAMAMHTRCC